METPLSFLQTGLVAFEHALDARGDDLHNVQLASIAADGRPTLRTLVLRGFTRTPATVEMHSDARAGKVDDIARDPRVGLLAWSAEAKLQLRFDGIARLHRGDDVARARWDALSENARRPYGLRARSGTPIADPQKPPHLPDDERFRQFVVILAELDGMDVLRLGPEGSQTRATGRFGSDGLAAQWVGA